MEAYFAEFYRFGFFFLEINDLRASSYPTNKSKPFTKVELNVVRQADKKLLPN